MRYDEWEFNMQNAETIADLRDNDEISVAEEGFMLGLLMTGKDVADLEY